MSWIGLLLKASVAAVLEWARQLLADAKARAAERDAGRAEQAATDNKERADENAKQAKAADEIGSVASRPMSRERNRDRLRDGSA